MKIPTTSLKSTWLAIARIFQAAIIFLTIILFIASLPINFKQRQVVCQVEPCPPDQLTLASVEALERMGLPVDSFVTMTIFLDILVALTYTICAAVIYVRKPADGFSNFVTIMLVTFGVATFTGGIHNLSLINPGLRWLTETIAMIGNCAIVAFLFIFPNGRFTPRWTAAIFASWVLFQLPRYYLPDSPLNLQAAPVLYNLLFSFGILSGIATQIYRYKRFSNAVERQQTKWVIYGLTIGAGGYIILRLSSLAIPDPLGNNLPVSIGVNILSLIFMLLIPLSISVAVMRYRLWDINPIINRTLVYGALSASTIVFYIVTVGFFSNYFRHSSANLIVSFLATGVIAFLFEPVRERLNLGVNRLMYGDRDAPATVLARLSQRLDATLSPESVLPTIADTVAQTLRLPYAAISLSGRDDETRMVVEVPEKAGADIGLRDSELIHLPLTYQSERVGELVLAPRAVGESFSSADLNLLQIIAKQAGIAAHALRLSTELRQLNVDLQQSRERLVTAQEEERRRLRRDLHDGIGPTLASLSQRLDTATDLVTSDPPASIELLKELKGQVKSTVAEIRRLVYALRPPVLDEFGLITAIREHIAPYTGPNGLKVAFEVVEPMPPLPAAVEVAAYRIVLEAFTNVIQHAEASQCDIKIMLGDAFLFLEIADNGKGLSTKTRSGVGLTSMGERAAELGGECTAENIPSGGTRIRARLPIESGSAILT